MERQAALEALLFEGSEPLFEPFLEACDEPCEEPFDDAPESLVGELESLVAELDPLDEVPDLAFSDARARALEP